ncbi:MAG: hypothetical protein KA319_00895 [Ferruginibacter sp.]|nr:hypothetical protein [Ferruginibacter sp.]
MKKIITLLMVFACLQTTHAQQIKNYKIANDTNKTERTLMLNLVRDKLYKEFKQEFVFSVDVFNVSKKYAWITADALRKDGKAIVFKEDEASFMDCCGVQALLIKKNNSWVVEEYGAFSTDVWYDGIWKRHNAPIALWGTDYHK